MKAGLLWAVLLVLALGWLAPTSAGATPWSPEAQAQAAPAAAGEHQTIRRHHRAHLIRAHHLRRHHRAAIEIARRSLADPAIDPAGAAPTASACAEGRDVTTCPDVAAANHALFMAHRRAIADGVPAPVLRVGYDAWSARRLAAARRSQGAVVDAYQARLAFVREAVALKPDWRPIFPPVAPVTA